MGTLLSLDPDEVTGYRAEIWFEYTRELFNLLREGSLVAVRNFSDRDQSKTDKRNRDREEFSILQIDQAMPWHYAIQGGSGGFPGFVVASAKSSHAAWTDHDEDNQDDVTRIKCGAVPVRLAFCETSDLESFTAFDDRSMPMPGGDVRLLSRDATDAIINHGLANGETFELGHHVVQRDVQVKVAPFELMSLHFGIFGFTGAGKSNLTSTLIRETLEHAKLHNIKRHFVVFDLMDEYTGLLIDQLVSHTDSRVVIAGRNAVDEALYNTAIDARVKKFEEITDQVKQTSITWEKRLTLPRELKKPLESGDASYWKHLGKLIRDGKVKFAESVEDQGRVFDLDLETLLKGLSTKGVNSNIDSTKSVKERLTNELNPLIGSARDSEAEDRDIVLSELLKKVEEIFTGIVLSNQASTAHEKFKKEVEKHKGSRGTIHAKVNMWGARLAEELSLRSVGPSLTIVIGENEAMIAKFAQDLIHKSFEIRRSRSIIDPLVSFFFDEADVFIRRRDSGDKSDSSLVGAATELARRGRKFGLGLGIATQRIRYLDTSIMAQPHTYFVSKLPRKSDRDAVAEAFAISEDSFAQTFGFGKGQWLITSHDATGLKGTPFPIQAPNANAAVLKFLGPRKAEGLT